MGEKCEAINFIQLAALRILYINSNYSIDKERCVELWKMIKKYRPKFLSVSDLTGRSIHRKEVFRTDEDNDVILTVLKLAYTLLQTTSYMVLRITKNGVDLSALQTGKGVFYITMRSIDNNKNLEVCVQTITNRY